MTLPKSSKGFTLIELIVVIAILAVLAVVLIATINPLDKINQANDAGALTAIYQLGRANDTFSATHSTRVVGPDNNGTPPAGNTQIAFSNAVTNLANAGEIKSANISIPNPNYTYNYYATMYNGWDCQNENPIAYCYKYAFWVTGLQSKKYAGNTIYVYANGLGCFKPTGTVITAATTCP